MKEPGVSTFKLTQHEVVFPRPIIIGIQLGGSAILLLDYVRHQLYSSAWPKFAQSLNLVWCSLTILSPQYTPKKHSVSETWWHSQMNQYSYCSEVALCLLMTNSHWLSSQTMCAWIKLLSKLHFHCIQYIPVIQCVVWVGALCSALGTFHSMNNMWYFNKSSKFITIRYKIKTNLLSEVERFVQKILPSWPNYTFLIWHLILDCLRCIIFNRMLCLCSFFFSPPPPQNKKKYEIQQT